MCSGGLACCTHGWSTNSMSCVPPALASPTTTAWTVVHSGRCGVDCGETSTPLRMTRAMLPGKPYMASCVRHVQAIGGVAAALARERLCERDRCGRSKSQSGNDEPKSRVHETMARERAAIAASRGERRGRRVQSRHRDICCRIANTARSKALLYRRRVLWRARARTEDRGERRAAAASARPARGQVHDVKILAIDLEKTLFSRSMRGREI